MKGKKDMQSNIYLQETIYDFDAFLPREKREEKKQKLEVVKTKEKTKEEIKEEKKVVQKTILKTVAISLLVAVIFSIKLCANVQLDQMDRKYDQLYDKYQVLHSHNIALETELNQLASLSSIEKVAVEELGLIKLNPAEIEYVKIQEESKVLVSDGKYLE